MSCEAYETHNTSHISEIYLESMVTDRRVRRVLATGRLWNLPVEILLMIWQEVHRAARHARHLLRRYILKIRVVHAFHMNTPDIGPGMTMDRWFELGKQLRTHWRAIAGWTPREIRYFYKLMERGEIPRVIREWPV